jgi:rfaE bifunctional protein kinase chain/domain
MLTDSQLERILERIPGLTVGVLGDLFLDRYLDIDAALTEPSLETGLDAYQVVRVRALPGAAGTIVNNLCALGTQRICPIAVIGDDGEGYELSQALARLRGVESRWVLRDGRLRTPTYTKPMLCDQRGSRELNRLDIKNRTPLPKDLEQSLVRALEEAWPQLDALLVLDQVSEADCGVVTARLRARLASLGALAPHKLILADSRERIGLFRQVSLKPNRRECLHAAFGSAADPSRLEQAVERLAAQTNRAVMCTAGEDGMLVAAPGRATARVPAYPVAGPIDPVGAGDSTSAAAALAFAAGAPLEDTAAFGNLVASITIQQLGTTGTATPEQVRQRWREVRG